MTKPFELGTPAIFQNTSQQNTSQEDLLETSSESVSDETSGGSDVPPDMEHQLRLAEAAAQNPVIDESERRRHFRFKVERAGKVFRRSTQQYVPVSSQDLSFGGTLLKVESERPFSVGEILDVGLAMSKRAIVPTSALLRGIVVRSEAIDEMHQRVAVRYLHPDPMALAA